ncbi:MAG TPA: tol-pal system protein YbgF [Burkholderiaceae bacterium]|nr:tol-pal system protein YbgF [Burkholderiaceae bacterium]
MNVKALSLRPVLLATAVSFAALCAAPAHAFSDDEARRAILELRSQVQQLIQQNQQARLQLADQIESLQNEVTDMRGQIEKLRWEADISKRSSQDQSGGATPSVTDPKEQAAYDQPMGLFRSGKYKEAATGFAAFIKNFPNSQLAPEAQFYEGSSRYASRDFKASIAELQSLVHSNPKDARAPDALLIIAASQIELNNVAGAKSNLQKIVKDYPDSSAADTAKSRLKLLK